MIQDLNQTAYQAEDLAKTVIGLAMKVHRVLGPGFLESVYANALLVELREAGIPAETEKRLNVYYRDVVVGEFLADLIIGEQLIIELKAVQNLSNAHSVQLVNYLTATHIECGLLLNFGSSSLEFKKKSRTLPVQSLRHHRPIKIS
ncbi:MAG: GxxExxY protein [Verrucomicrobia bacterium Tous-C9LFEB]|nr:MAG: GxxExxY protein [Verrucomicrobia bacterium Tous-C9LFEB]